MVDDVVNDDIVADHGGVNVDGNVGGDGEMIKSVVKLNEIIILMTVVMVVVMMIR